MSPPCFAGRRWNTPVWSAIALVLSAPSVWGAEKVDSDDGALVAPLGVDAPSTQAPGPEGVGPEQSPEKPRPQPRVVVVPVVVGGGERPSPEFIAGMAEGLKENLTWRVTHSVPGTPFQMVDYPSPSADLRREFEAALVAAESARQAGNPQDTLAAFAKVLTAIQAARASGPLGPEDQALLVRAGGGLVQAQVVAGLEQEARATADRIALLLPGRTFSAADGLSPVALAFLSSARADAGAEVEVVTRPLGCAVQIDGRDLGKGPLKLRLQPGASYYMRALCDDKSETPASRLRRIVADNAEGSQTVVLDAEFMRAFVNTKDAPSGPELRFASGSVRRQLEPSYARGLAEALDADIIVLISTGDLGGNQWVNGRLFLSSGFKNRQGLARPESHRVVALGRYLGSGKDSMEVLRSEEVGELIARTRTGPRRLEIAAPETVPWYTDVTGWTLVGVGAVGVGVGLWLNSIASDKFHQADFELRGMGDEQDRTRAEGQAIRFWGQAGLFGGGVMIATGAILLIAPEYGESRSELFAVAPTLDGGAKLTWSGRF